MAKFINARLRQPRDSEANWNNKNPTLLNGERVFVDIYDENNILIETKEKIGDGNNEFTALPYFSISSSSGSLISSEDLKEDTIIKKNQMVLVPNTVTVESVEEDGTTPIQREQTFYSAKIGNDLPLSETTYLANLKAGDGWGSVIQVEVTTEGDTNAAGTKYITPSATGQRAVALGKYTEASGNSSMAINYDTHALGDKSFAINSNTTAEGLASFAAGHVSKASGYCSTALGSYTTAEGSFSFSGGLGSTEPNNQGGLAKGKCSFAFGDRATALTDNSIAIGASAQAGHENKEDPTKNSFGIAFGTGATATGDLAVAIGQGTKALAQRSVVMGYGNKADTNGSYSFVAGNSNTANHAYATIFGAGNVSTGSNQLLMGNYSKPWCKDNNNKDFFVIGNGANSNSKNNLFSIGANNSKAYIKFEDDTTLTASDVQNLKARYTNKEIDDEIDGSYNDLYALISSDIYKKFQIGPIDEVPTTLQEGQIYFGY